MDPAVYYIGAGIGSFGIGVAGTLIMARRGVVTNEKLQDHTEATEKECELCRENIRIQFASGGRQFKEIKDEQKVHRGILEDVQKTVNFMAGQHKPKGG